MQANRENETLLFSYDPNSSAELLRILQENSPLFSVVMLDLLRGIANVSFNPESATQLSSFLEDLKRAEIPKTIYLPVVFASLGAIDGLLAIVEQHLDEIDRQKTSSGVAPRTAETQTLAESSNRNDTLAALDQREPHRAVIQMITQAFSVANNMQAKEQQKEYVCEVCTTITAADSLQAAKDELTLSGFSLKGVGPKSWPVLKQAAQILINTYSDSK